jgi:hypothetical protein
MRRVAPVLVLLVALLGLSLPAVGAGAPPAQRALQASADAGSAAQVDTDPIVNGTVTTELVVEVRPNTDARWSVRTRYRLETENDTQAFRELVEDLRADRAETSYGPELFRNYAAGAEAATGREMNVTDVSYDGTVRDGGPEPGDEYQKVGVLTLSFTWTDFAEKTEDGRLRVGDVFAAPDGGVWLPSLDADQRIVFVTPEGYGVDRSISSETKGDRRIIDGPRQFRRGVWFVYGPDEESPGESTTPDREGGILPGGLDPVLLGGLGIVLIVAGVVAYAVATRDDDGAAPGSDGGPSDDDGSGTAVESVQQDDFDHSLLSDEERVEYLLERNGGRMRQAAIVEETGWSDAKVSQLLSAMADDDRVNKLRIGRENLISLPGHDPADEPLGNGREGDQEGEGSPDNPTEGTSV